MGRKLGEFGESSAVRQTKTKVMVTIDNPLADLFIYQSFSRQMLEKIKFAKHSACCYTVMNYRLLGTHSAQKNESQVVRYM